MNVTAIIPMFNEQNTIKNVLGVLNDSKSISSIIVVDDASTDNSLKIVKEFNSNKLRVISLKRNVGKSDAVKIATNNLKTDVLFFCDADLRYLNQEHIEQILEPFKINKNVMSVGMRDYGFIFNALSKHVFPLITGERALPYSIFKEASKNPQFKDYNMEVILNKYCKINKIQIHKNICKGLRQTAKYNKWRKGYYLLARQIIQVMIAIISLNINWSRYWK